MLNKHELWKSVSFVTTTQKPIHDQSKLLIKSDYENFINKSENDI